MVYFIGYDIADSKSLARVANILENFGIRVQKSFFECEMNRAKMNDVCDSILAEMDLKSDKLQIYPICEDCLSKSEIIGRGGIDKPQTFMIL
ncbi:MAG: CRISPR-associated endonuclease Cas2 [Spirochaetales bacterium]|nr:CRISPR-associated endonuclease Cas2 [Spirochaetales bacterium]